MDDALTWMGWLVSGASLATLIGAAFVEFRRRATARGRMRNVALLRRRRELTQRLNQLAGPKGMELARRQARRLGTSPLSIEALEAAIERAESPEPEGAAA